MDTKKDYLPHIYDATRRSIAERYIRYELRKFFPNLRDENAWNAIDQDVGQWFQGNPTLVPIRDFWNGFHGISAGFKLKENMTAYLTSANMKWEEHDMPIESFWFGKNFQELEHLPSNPSATDVRDWYYSPENSAVLEHVRLANETRYRHAIRSEFSLIAIQRDGKLGIIDGDRRLLWKILQGNKTAHAIIGIPLKEPAIFEQWVPTSTLQDSVAIHRRAALQGRDYTKEVAQMLAVMIRDSSSGRIELSNRVFRKRIDSDLKLWKAVERALKVYGHTLDPIEL